MENKLVEDKFGTGGIPDSYDSRDLQYKDIAGAPIPFDWNEGFDIEIKLGLKIPIKNQGSSYSCGGQAWSYLAEILEAISTKTFEERSAKYIYAQTFVPGGGSAGRDNANIFIKQGVATEKILTSKPNTEGFLTSSIDITPTIREDAKSDLSLSYAQTGTNIETIAMAMRDNGGVILGIDGSNNGTWLSAFPKPPIEVEWKHWVYAGKAKLINGIKHIGILNSWGDTVGEKGWQWLAEGYFSTGTTGHVWGGWTHILKEIPVKPVMRHFDVDLYYLSSGDEINRLQRFLGQLGYFTTEPTGYFGNLTRQAVFNFQKDYIKLTPWEYLVRRGNLVGPKTRTALNAIIDNK